MHLAPRQPELDPELGLPGANTHGSGSQGQCHCSTGQGLTEHPTRAEPTAKTQDSEKQGPRQTWPWHGAKRQEAVTILAPGAPGWDGRE